MLVRAFKVKIGREIRCFRMRAHGLRALRPPITVWCVEPESNHTSRVSVHLRYCCGIDAEVLVVAVCQASMPPCLTLGGATFRAGRACRGCSSSGLASTKNGIGMPHCRWRDSVQSGRLAIMP